jgi:hypothetical protein
MTIKGNTSESIQFLQAWAPEDNWQLTAIVPDGKIITQTFAPGDERAKNARKWIDDRQGRENIYFTVNPLIRAMNAKPKKEDMRGMSALHVDIDPRPGEDMESERKRALKLLREFKPAPTVIIDSGGGYQGFWLLDQEHKTDGDLDRSAELEAYNLQIEVLTQADSCHNIDRIMRLPGTLNVPNAKKRKKGREVYLARVVEAEWDRVYSLKQFTPAARVQSPGGGSTGGGQQVRISGNLPSIDLEDLPITVSARTKALIVNGDDPDDPTRWGSRSEATWHVMCELVRNGCSDDQIAAIFLDPDYGISGHVLDQPRPQQYLGRQLQRAKEDAIDPWLRKLNEEHAVIEDIGGKCRVVSEVFDPALKRPRLSRQSFDDFRNRYMHIQVVVGQDKDGNDVRKPLGKWWLENPNRRQYKSIVFAPGKEVSDSYNLWQGFSCEAKPGDCELLLTHIKENVCRGNEVHSEYILNWMARAVQTPDSPGQVALVLRGRMGTGKGVVFKHFGSLWGRHYLHVSDPKHLVGSFNAHLRDCVVLFADEAFYAGDKKHESIMKTLVTEEMIMTESKGVDAEAAPNYVHLGMASNDTWVVPAGADERRYCLIDVGDGAMQNGAYFAAIQKQMDNGGREAFLHFLVTRDLSGFDVRKFPKTEALQEQKVLSMSPEEQWWFEKLNEGHLTGDDWKSEVPKLDLQKDYLAYCDRQKINRRVSPTALGKFLKRVLPDIFPQTFQKVAEVEVMDRFGHPVYRKSKIWFYGFPALDRARAHFDERFGGPYQWPNVNEAMDETEMQGQLGETESDTPF